MLGSKRRPVFSWQPSPTRHGQATTKTMLDAALVGCELEKRTGKRPCRDETQKRLRASWKSRFVRRHEPRGTFSFSFRCSRENQGGCPVGVASGVCTYVALLK